MWENEQQNHFGIHLHWKHNYSHLTLTLPLSFLLPFREQKSLEAKCCCRVALVLLSPCRPITDWWASFPMYVNKFLISHPDKATHFEVVMWKHIFPVSEAQNVESSLTFLFLSHPTSNPSANPFSFNFWIYSECHTPAIPNATTVV